MNTNDEEKLHPADHADHVDYVDHAFDYVDQANHVDYVDLIDWSLDMAMFTTNMTQISTAHSYNNRVIFLTTRYCRHRSIIINMLTWVPFYKILIYCNQFFVTNHCLLMKQFHHYLLKSLLSEAESILKWQWQKPMLFLLLHQLYTLCWTVGSPLYQCDK